MSEPSITPAPTDTCYFFAGGGTGGHIYPGLAIAQQIRRMDPAARILFFCSARPIDAQILAATDFEYIPLPGRGFSPHPLKAANCALDILKAYDLARKKMRTILKAHTTQTAKPRSILVGIGGFASIPAVFAAGRLGLPLAMVNVDIVPGKANRLVAPFVQKIFTQWPETAPHFGRRGTKAVATGCPLRESFDDPDPRKAVRELKLHPNRKTLLVTGASSGSLSINNAVSAILPRLDAFADTWQVVHLTGSAASTRDLETRAAESKIAYRPLDYYDDMASLLAAADLVVGRAGAVSIAEFAATGTPAVCLPYPWHKDRHQYLNAETLVRAGAATIVDDRANEPQITADNLLAALQTLMADDKKRTQMAQAAKAAAKPTAAEAIATELAKIAT
jgi:UDP-N-acetylglucosamine--N-acetylmuramyl-(pentapeptide) pyrophosphoryl-undecaprenol N-acetylglucosamine transferase